MHKLRHIQSKIGTETAFRIPVSVEDAIAEAVETYDALKAQCEFLEGALKEVLGKFADDESKNYYENIINCPPFQCLLLHDADVLEKAGDNLLEDSNNAYVNGYTKHAGGVIDAANILIEEADRLRKKADALEGEGDDRS